MTSTHAPDQRFISLVVPAYQEEKRIGMTIDALSRYLQDNHPGSELIVVSDGSTDRTLEVARENFHAPDCSIKTIQLPINGGKGRAVQTGVMHASGEYIFFTDADLSFEPAVLDLFLEKLIAGGDIAVAQRSKNVVYPNWARRTVAVISRFLIGNLVLPGIRDSQAGYKGFRRDIALYLFPRLKTTRFLFDLELLIMAKRKNLKIEKVYVDWVDRPGSTVRIGRDTIRSTMELFLILFWGSAGAYRLNEPVEPKLIEQKQH